jgi:hypothetical protein
MWNPMKRTRWGELRLRTKIALIVLAAMRGLVIIPLALSSGVLYGEGLGLVSIGSLWLIGVAVFALLGFRWAIWIAIAGDAVVILFGLMALPEFSHLHGGQIFTILAIPALVELVAGAVALFTMRQSKNQAS